jgi:hypothetical protein
MKIEQPRKPTQMRFVLMALLGVIVGAPLAGILYFGVKRHQISTFDSAFAGVKIGDEETKVDRAMGPAHKVRIVDQFDFPKTKYTEGGDVRGAEQLCYSVHTFFLPITWVITIDSNRQVQCKHRLD